MITTSLPPATIIMNFHNEDVYAHKSLLGFLRIREYSALQGNQVNLICIMDNPTILTEKIVCNFIKNYGNKNDKIIKLDYKNVSAARNTGIDLCDTEYLGFNDGDDIFSANRVEKMLLAQLNSQKEILCFPEKIISFGIRAESYTIPNSSDIPKAQMINHHFWTYASFGHISTYKSQYFNETVGKNSRFAFEDWDFHLRCIAANVEMTPITDTYLFYRRRENSLFSEHSSYNSFIPPSNFFQTL